MRSKRQIKAEYNRERRKRRRMQQSQDRCGIELFKDPPTLAELKDALRSVRKSHLDIIRLAALMDNLGIYYQFRVESGKEDWRGHTSGIRKFLAKDGYLSSRYDTLMRYKRLGDSLRDAAEVDNCVNLLWGISQSCPTDDGEPIFEDDWRFLRNFYASFEGMNFKQINENLKGWRK